MYVYTHTHARARTHTHTHTGLCDNNVEENDYWSCKFRVCKTDGCNFSAAPTLMAGRACAAVLAAVLALALIGV